MSIADFRRELASKVQAARTSANQPIEAAAPSTVSAPAEPQEDAMLGTLEDSSAPPEERLRALGGLKVLAFASPNASKFRPRFIEGLRKAVDNPELRIGALHTLSQLGDPSTRELLLSGLRQPSKAVVPAADAFNLLTSDPHGDAIPEAREAVDRADDDAEVVAALSLLARDPTSKTRLQKIVADTAVPETRRRAAAESLFALDKDALLKTRVAGEDRMSAFLDGLLRPPSNPTQGNVESTSKRKAAKRIGRAGTSARSEAPNSRAATAPRKASRTKPGVATNAKRSHPHATTRRPSKKPNAAFIKAMTPSAALAKIVGEKPLPRAEIVKKLWAYVKKNKLQDKTKKQKIKADETLREVFGGKTTLSTVELETLVKNKSS
jgi:upstream activation factor subunit UAF30